MSLRDKILGAAARPAVPMEIPEWGVTVYLRHVTLGGSFAIFEAKTPTERATRMLMLAVHDEAGAPLFTEADAAKLLELDAVPTSRLLEAIDKMGQTGGLAAAGEGSGATAG